jgi:hypothetical protein
VVYKRVIQSVVVASRQIVGELEMLMLVLSMSFSSITRSAAQCDVKIFYYKNSRCVN